MCEMSARVSEYSADSSYKGGSFDSSSEDDSGDEDFRPNRRVDGDADGDERHSGSGESLELFSAAEGECDEPPKAKRRKLQQPTELQLEAGPKSWGVLDVGKWIQKLFGDDTAKLFEG